MDEDGLPIASDALLAELENRAALVKRRIDLPMSAIAVSIEDLLCVLRRLRRAETGIERLRDDVSAELSRWADDETLEKRIGEISVRELRIASELIQDLSANVRRALSPGGEPVAEPATPAGAP